jgi:hypothetical protein
MGVIAEHNGDAELIDLSSIKDSSSKLSAYAHLFNSKALEEFNQLT